MAAYRMRVSVAGTSLLSGIRTRMAKTRAFVPAKFSTAFGISQLTCIGNPKVTTYSDLSYGPTQCFRRTPKPILNGRYSDIGEESARDFCHIHMDRASHKVEV